jgi:hypothetical protein
MASIPGRADTQADVIGCTVYLGHRQSRRRGPTHEIALKAKSAIATAIVRNSIRPAKSTDSEQELVEANRTIDRLLAFVPVRAPSVPFERLTAILRELDNIASQSFLGFQRTAITVEPEGERDTTACHRVTVRVFSTSTADARSMAEGIAALHLALAELTTPDELQAITLLVELEQA